MILVTGATGHVGGQVIRTLRKLGMDARALVRKGSEYYWLNDTGCKYFFGDLRDPESLRRAANDCTGLVVASGVQVEHRDNHHANVTVQGHKDLFEAAKQKGIGKVVFISCMGVDRDYPAPGFDARRQAEEALVATGLDYTILRSCAHERLFLDMAWWVHDHGAVPFFGPGTNTLSPLPARDLALMAVASLDDASMKRRIVDVAGLEQMTAIEAFELACKTVGVDPQRRVLPKPLVSVGRRLGTPLKRWGHRIAELSAWMSDDFTVDPSVMKSTFQIPTTSLAEAMQATNREIIALRDPAAREKKMVHPQFYATVYEPGTVAWDVLPDGPPPRRD